MDGSYHLYHDNAMCKLKSYSDISYHNKELNALCRCRFDKVKYLAKLKVSFLRLVNILLPELEALVPTLNMA